MSARINNLIFMVQLLVAFKKKRFPAKGIIRWALLSILFFSTSCSQETDQEALRKREFYTRLLFIESAAFTLCGSKPMTEIALDHRSKGEKEFSRQQYLLNMSEEERKIYEESDKVAWNPTYDFEESWRLWEKGLDKSRMNRFLIVHFPRNSNEYDFVYIVNILELATVLKQHYCLFQKYMGFDFDPLEVVFELQNKDSIFWNKIFNETGSSEDRICLLGLLYGYGIENSYPFSLVFSKRRSGASRDFASYLLNDLATNMKRVGLKRFSSSKFAIPGFRTFSENNPTQMRYEREREKIIDSFKGKGLAENTYELLYK